VSYWDDSEIRISILPTPQASGPGADLHFRTIFLIGLVKKLYLKEYQNIYLKAAATEVSIEIASCDYASVAQQTV
jgi:hypothetical protein